MSEKVKAMHFILAALRLSKYFSFNITLVFNVCSDDKEWFPKVKRIKTEINLTVSNGEKKHISVQR